MTRRRRLSPPPSPPPDGFVLRRGRSGELEEFPCELIEQFSRHSIEDVWSLDPNWKDDPTYNLRKRK